MTKKHRRTWSLSLFVLAAIILPSRSEARQKNIIFVAGSPSHGYGAHDHSAGSRLLAEHLEASGLGIKTSVVYPGWPTDPKAFDGADAVIFYADGALRHPVLSHLAEVSALAKKGIGLGFIHFAVEIEKGEAGDKLLDWIGGYFEQHWSVNPFWTPDAVTLAKHPITQGVRPFSIKDEWYFHMRFRPAPSGIIPVLSAVPTADTLNRGDGPWTGNADVRAAVANGIPQHLVWARQRPDGGRGFGFTGGHIHWNWAHPDQRRLVLNAIAWIAKVNIPKGGLPTKDVTIEDLEKNADEPVPPTFDRLKTAALIDSLKPSGKAASNGWQILDDLKVGGDGDWDFLEVDPIGQRLYVPRSTSVMVIDLVKKAVVGQVKNTPIVHGVALVPNANRGFTANGDGTITVFDLKTLETTATLKAGLNPDYIMYDAATARVFVFNNKSGDVTVVDPKKSEVIATIPVGGELELAASDGKGTIFVASEDKHEVAVIDAKKLIVKTRWPVAPCQFPTGVALDTKFNRLFVGCASKHLVVMDSKNGKVISTLPIGAGVDGVVFDATKKLVFVPGGKDGNLTVIKADGPNKFSVVQTIVTGKGARTVALDPQTHRLYLPTVEYGPTPPATNEVPKPKAPRLPNSFHVLVVGPR